jgi:hypothetical protein
VTDQQQWDDLYFRHNFDDTGMYPTSGSLSASPDIIPLGSAPVSDPSYLISDGNWGKDYGNSTNASEANYIYLRGQNLSDADVTGAKLYLYYSPASLLLWPSDPLDPKKGWAKNPLQTSNGAKSITVSPKAGARFVTPEGFMWVPQPISNDHYCLVSRVSTDKNPNPVPELGTITDFAVYISEHPDMAWRNVVTINPANPESTTQMNYSQGTEGGDVYLIMRCENVPDGSAVSFSSGTPGPDPMIYMQKTTVVNTVGSDGVPRFSLTLLTNIPANWSSNIAYTWYSEGKNPLPGLKVWFEAIMPTTTDHPVLGSYARPLAEFGIEAPQIGPTAGIKLGSQLMQTLPVAINSPASRVYGESRRAVPTAETSSVLFSGVSWGQRTSSVFGSSASTFDVAVVREEQSNVVTEVVTLSDATPVQGGDESSDVAVDAAFESGPYTGMTLATLTAKNLPVGCEIWFHNLDGTITIAVAPTKVNNSSKFTVSSTIDDMPAQYAAQIRVSLRLNGNVLPTGAELAFSMIGVVEENTGAPTPGKVLGTVTLRP